MQYRRSRVQSDRGGVNASLSRRFGPHALAGGLWYEESRFLRQRYLYDLVDWQVSPTVDFRTPAETLLDRVYDSLKGDIALSDRWLVSLGLKTSRIHTGFVDHLGVYPANTVVSRGDLLPQVGLNYAWDAHNELFGYYAENVGAVPITVFTTKVFNPGIKPERSVTWEGGWRRQRDDLELSLAVFHIDYRDRLLQISNCSLLGTCPSLVANVAVRKIGAEGMLQWRFLPGWTVSASLMYGDSRYRENYVSNGKTVATAGKTTVDTPQWIAAWELRRQYGGWFGAIRGKYVGERQASYTNDLAAPAFALWSLGAGYECQTCFGLQRLRVQANVENLTDRDYVATLGQGGFSASDPTGADTYVQVGAPRMVFASVELGF